MSEFTEKRVEVSRNMYKTIVEESGTTTWDASSGRVRAEIIDTIGMEYKQINLLAEVLAEMVKEIPALLDNKVIAEGLNKFGEINAIRGLS